MGGIPAGWAEAITCGRGLMISRPRSLTWWRGWSLISHPESTLLRLLEYESIRGLVLEGVILDVGGGAATSYYPLLSITGIVHAVNIDHRIRPNYLADLDRGIPVGPNSYDNVICFNTLEHLWLDMPLLVDILRIMKPGGRLYAMVPFIYRVHASPSDYHRHTAFYWAGALAAMGFQNVDIEPLTFGPFAAALSLVEFRFSPIIRRLLRVVFLSIPVLKIKMRPHFEADNGGDAPLGYFIRARK